jgi:hypothetical protein
MIEFKTFLIELFKQLSTGDFNVNVECGNNQLFTADVVGYDEEYMTIKVKFHSDKLTKPGRKEIPFEGFGYETEETFTMVDCNIPVKVENIWWESIKLRNNK